jgi:hypothetical protein
MNKLGEKPSDEELEDMIRAVDLNVSRLYRSL